jgi:hypothetical protein
MHPEPAKERELEREISRPALWFTLWSGAVAWLLHLLLVYGIAEFGCGSGLGDRHVLGISVVAWLLLAVTAATMLLALAATFVGWRSARQSQEVEPDLSAEHHARLFTARAGWITNSLFAVVIVIQAIPIFFFLRDCG